MNKLYKTPIVSAIILLLWPLVFAMIDPYDSLPEGYFTLLRIIVCGVAIYLSVIAYNIKKLSWMWTIGFIAILFNPFIQIHLEEESWWLFIDFAVSITLLLGIFALSDEGATKSIFKTKAFRIFKKVALVIFFCILAIVLFLSVNNYLRKGLIQRRLPPGFVLEEKRPAFDFNSARTVGEYFIETYSKGNVIIIGKINIEGKTDIWRIYDKYGALRAEKEYAKGILVEVRVFDENGELIRKYPCKEGEIRDGIDPSDNAYVTDYDVATRETYQDVSMYYRDGNIKAKLLTPYLDKKNLIFKIDIEAINKTKIIKNMQYGLIGGYLKDNFGNLITITSRIPFGNPKLRFGDKNKITFSSTELPLRNAVYFHLRIPKNTIWNLDDMNFIFPAFFIEERTNSNN